MTPWNEKTPDQKRRTSWLAAAFVAVAVSLTGYLVTYQPPEDPPRDRVAEACAKAVGYETSVLARCIATIR